MCHITEWKLHTVPVLILACELAEYQHIIIVAMLKHEKICISSHSPVTHDPVHNDLQRLGAPNKARCHK